MSLKIAVVSSSRADYGHLYWPLREIEEHPDLELQLVVFGAHLSPEYGSTISEIEADGFVIADKLECLLSSDSDVGMAKTIGMATLALADSLSRLQPDLLLVIADRYEMMAPATVALALRIPIAHIEGGDLSEGAIDQQVRDALTKMSHIHLCPTEKAKQRVLAMGEEDWRVHRIGAPSLDHLKRSQLPSKEELFRKLNLDPQSSPIVVAYHPVTISKESCFETEEFFRALEQLDEPIVFCFPNADTGSHQISKLASEFCEQREDSHLFVNLAHLDYWALLKSSKLLIGNSSSGIMESPSLELPTINIGIRQWGREQAANIIQCDANSGAILQAIDKSQSSEFTQSMQGLSNPYGDGDAAKRMVKVLAALPQHQELIRKSIVAPA